jgi:hypothetical protein
MIFVRPTKSTNVPLPGFRLSVPLQFNIFFVFFKLLSPLSISQHLILLRNPHALDSAAFVSGPLLTWNKPGYRRSFKQ